MENNGKTVILIIEDEAVFRLIYRGVFENAGFSVIEAKDGKAGWYLAKEKKPDLILLDLILPEMSGYEVLEKVRADEVTKNIPVVIFSIIGEPKDIQKAIDLGANFYSLKGVQSPTKMLTIIRELLTKTTP